MTIGEFLAARFAEDEHDADMLESDANASGHGRLVERTRRGCEAKRRIVERFQETAPPWGDARQQEIHETLAEDVLPFLVLPYASHPDCDEEWRP